MRWKIGQAKQRFSEMVRHAATEPQLICNRDRVVAAVVDADSAAKLLGILERAGSDRLPTLSRTSEPWPGERYALTTRRRIAGTDLPNARVVAWARAGDLPRHLGGARRALSRGGAGMSDRPGPLSRTSSATIDGMSDGRQATLRVPEALQEPFRSALVAAVDVWLQNGERLVSIVLFGSVARGQARPESDVDLLVVAEGLPRSLADRRRPLLEAWERVRGTRDLPYIEWNLIIKTPSEARGRSPLYLDLVEDAILILDRHGFFEGVLSGMRARMRELGSRRIHLPNGSWYWDLKPDFRFGEIVEI